MLCEFHLSLELRCEPGGEVRLLLQYMDVTATSDMVEENVGSIFVR